MLFELRNGKKTVGRKQSQRAVLEGKAQKIFLASDADARIRQEVEAALEQAEIERDAAEAAYDH